MNKFNIGDKVWYARTGGTQKTVICPECFGKKFLTVILGDDSQVTIDCAGCAMGFEPPKGYVTYWEWGVDVKEVVIERLEIEKDKIEYGFLDCYRAESNRIFPTKEEAEKRALELAEEHNKEELARIHRKEKNNHTWAWNAYHHRDCIRRAENDLVYHKAKLDVAKIKAKEDKVQSDRQ